MSQFEYIMVMAALIMALALAQALRGLTEIITSRDHYWPLTLWLITLVLILFQGWWADWDYNAVDQWQFTTYLSALVTYVITFAQIHLLVPATRDAEIDWRAQFMAVKGWLYGLMIVYIVLAFFQGTVYFGTPIIHPYRIFQGLWITTAIVGILVNNEKVHIVLPLIFATSLITGQLLIRMDIGALMGG